MLKPFKVPYDDPDLPDWTTGVDILAQSIGTLAVDIAAQTISELNVDIAAQSVGNLNVNLAASAITLNVAITSSAITLNVNISSQTANLNVNLAASAITLNVAITSSAITLNVNISSQTANLNVNLAASAITLNVAITSSVQLNINIAASAVTLNINISSQSAFNLNVNLAASAITLNVAITSSAVTLNVNISSQTANLNVNLAASAITLNVAITSSAVTLNVSVTSSIDINIKTSAGVNIIIDKLSQTATRGDYRTLTTSDLTTPSGYRVMNNIWGVSFARGCRGLIRQLQMWLKNTSGSAQNLIAHIAPYFGASDIITGTISVPNGTDGYVDIILGGSTALKSQEWLYDRLCIWFDVNTSLYLGEDGGQPLKNGAVYYGGAWYPELAFMGKLYIGSLTVGDIPISGVVNAVILPDETVKYGGLWDQPNYSAKKGVDKNFFASGVGIASEYSGFLNYTVPAGKSLYISGISGALTAQAAGSRDLNQNCWVKLLAGADVLAVVGGFGGAVAIFSKPFKILAGVAMQLSVWNMSDHLANVQACCNGWEI